MAASFAVIHESYRHDRSQTACLANINKSSQVPTRCRAAAKTAVCGARCGQRGNHYARGRRGGERTDQ